jgi:ADP-ribose pyrophosphatase
MSELDNDNEAEQASTVLVKKLSRVFDGFLKIDEAVVSYRRFDGRRTTVTRLSMDRGDSVAVLPVNINTRKVWLIEQFRFPTLDKGPGWIEEVPAGIIEKHESNEDAARRETAEETGLSVDALEHVATFYVSPGGTSERIALYIGFVTCSSRDPHPRANLRDPEEDVRLVEQDLDVFLTNARLGRLNDAKTLVAALWLIANPDRFDQQAKGIL